MFGYLCNLQKHYFQLISFYGFKLYRNGTQAVRNINEIWSNGGVSKCTI